MIWMSSSLADDKEKECSACETLLSSVEQNVERFLLLGAENAPSTTTFVRLTGLGLRDLRAQVARERETGPMVLSRIMERLEDGEA